MEVYELLADAGLLAGPRFVGAALWDFIRRGRGSVVADVPALKAKIFPGEFCDKTFRDYLRQLKEAGVIVLEKEGETWLIKRGAGKFALAAGPAPAKKTKKARDESPIVLTYPCQGPVAEWHLREAQVEKWARLFPSLDVLQSCRSALAYVTAGEMKTARGMPRFLVSWLDRDVRWGHKAAPGAFGAIRDTKPRGDLARAFAEFGAN